MPKQPFDHSDFIAGRLHKHQQFGWADQVVLAQGPRSLWLMQSKHIIHSDGKRGFDLQIEKYAKATNPSAFDTPERTLLLSEEAVRNLFDYLQRQQALGHIDLGSGWLAIPLGVNQVDISTKQIDAVAALFRSLIEGNQLSKLLAAGQLTKQVLENIGAASLHVRYKTAVAELRNLLDTVADENTYQRWFEAHPWICGTNYVKVGLRRIGLHEVTDFVMETTDGYLDLIELKRPVAQVLMFDRSRNSHFFSRDVSQAIAQAAGYVTKTEENRHMLAQTEKLFFLKPRARIVIGRSSTWEQPQRDALRVLNGSLHFIEVWTYDHLLAMADQMVSMYEEAAASTTSREPPSIEDDFLDDDLPF